MFSSQASFPSFSVVSSTISPSYLKVFRLHLSSEVNYFKFSFVKPFAIQLPIQLHQDELKKKKIHSKKKKACDDFCLHSSNPTNSKHCTIQCWQCLRALGRRETMSNIQENNGYMFLKYHCSHFYASYSTTVLSSSVEMFCKVNRCMVKMSAIPVRAQDRDVKNK